MKNNKDLLKFIFAMAVFGTVGIFRRYLPFDSGLIAMARGFLGAVFIFAYLAIKGRKFSFSDFHGKAWVVILSGMVMGFNWMTLFEAYRYTSVATASLCYYMEPVFLILVSPVLFHEKLTKKKILCVAAAVLGMVLVTGVLRAEPGANDMKGIAFGLLSGILYAVVVCITKLVQEVDIYEKTALQLLSAGAAVLPYVALKGVFSDPALLLQITPFTVGLLLFVGFFHTGYTYILYFGAIEKLKMQQVAIFSYIDPVVAIILSQVILHENMGWDGFLGAVLILGAAIVSELRTDEEAA